MKGENLAFVAATSATYNIILQVSMRILTFVLNAFILRYVTKEVLGVINVRLLLLYTTVQFLTREPFRRASLSSKEQRWTQITNMIWCTVPTSIVIGAVLRHVWLHWLHQPPPPSEVRGYEIGVNAVVISVTLEMFAEPLFVTAQSHGFVRVKVVAEGLLVTVRSVCVSVLVMFYPQYGILAYSIGQFLASVGYITFYYVYFFVYINKVRTGLPLQSLWDVLPKRLHGSWLDWNTLMLTWSFLKQTVLKQILTEGERYIMTIFDILSFSEQGVYDVVNNLGSLAARFIFQPVEESGYLYFAQVLKRGEPISKQHPDSVSVSGTIVHHLVKLMMVLGVVILTFGLPYSQLLLYLYGGDTLVSGIGPTLLRWHCFYVLFIAINGVTECFVFATMSQTEIERYNRKILLLSVVFLTSSYFFTVMFGSVGFIMANCLNMGCRISHSVFYICRFYNGTTQPLLEVHLKLPVVLTLFVSLCLTLFSESYFCCSRGFFSLFLHFVVGAVCFFSVLVTIVLTEKQLVAFLYKLWKKEDFSNIEKKK